MTCDISARVRTSQILPRQHANAWQRPAIENHCQVASTEDPQRQVTGADRYIDRVIPPRPRPTTVAWGDHGGMGRHADRRMRAVRALLVVPSCGKQETLLCAAAVHSRAN